MKKRKCILKNSISGAVCELEFDLDKTLVNNIRVWCHLYGEQMRHFVPKKYYEGIMKDTIIQDVKIVAQIYFGKQFVHIQENVKLSEQIGRLKYSTEMPEIRLNIDNYVLSKDELDIYQGSENFGENSEVDSIKEQLIVVYHDEIDAVKGETFEAAEIDSATKSNKNGAEKKKKFKIVPILLGLAVLGGAAGFGAFTIVNHPVNKIEKMVTDGNYKDAVALYNEKISGDEKNQEKVDEMMFGCIDTLMETYKNDNGMHDEVTRDLTAFASIENDAMSERAEEYLAKIQLNEEANEIYLEAEESYEAGDYLTAMALYKNISEEAQVYGDASEKYVLCRENLLAGVANPQTAEDYMAYMSLVDSYLVLVSDEEFIAYKNKLVDEYAVLVENTVRDTVLKNAEDAFLQGAYSNVFTILEQGLEELPGDLVLEEKAKEYQSMYVDVIKNQVEELVSNKNYSQALTVLSTALSVYECDEFKILLARVEQLKAEALGVYQAATVEFLTYQDKLENKEQKNEYEFTAGQTGRYGISVTNLVSGFKITVRVYDGKTGEQIEYSRGMTNNSNFYVNLQQNQAYKVVVEYYSEFGEYTLKIGQQKATVDVSNVNVVNDSIEYANQNNKYTFLPEYTGNYRLDFSNIKSNFKLSVYVYDSLGYEVNRYRGVSNENGLTLGLNGGELYTIAVMWYSGTGDYSMAIGRQSYLSTMALGNSVSDTIDFVDQTNFYKFTPAEDGSYILNFSGMESGFKVSVYVFDSLGYEVERYRGLGNDGTLKFNGETGEEYKIRVSYYSKMGEYTFSLNRNVGE